MAVSWTSWWRTWAGSTTGDTSTTSRFRLVDFYQLHSKMTIHLVNCGSPLSVERFILLLCPVCLLFLFFTVQGLVSNLTLGKDILEDWTMYSLSIDQTLSQGLLRSAKTRAAPQTPDLSLPTFYEGNFIIPDGIPDLPQDTYIRLPNWTKACHPHTSKQRQIHSHRVVFLYIYLFFLNKINEVLDLIN